MASNPSIAQPIISDFVDTIAHHLAGLYSQSLIESECVSIMVSGEFWYDLTTTTDVSSVEAFCALTFLEHHDRLRRHPERNTLVQITPQVRSSFEEVN